MMMARYTFSKHAKDDLQQFLIVAQNNQSDKPNELAKYWQIILPKCEIPGELKSDSTAQDQLIDLISESPEGSKSPSPPSTADNEQFNANFIILEELLNQNHSSVDETCNLLKLCRCEELSSAFSDWKAHENAVHLCDAVLLANDANIQKTFFSIVVIHQMQIGRLQAMEMLQRFFQSHSELASFELVQFMCSFKDENAEVITKAFQESLRQLPQQFKQKILSSFVSTAEEINEAHLTILNNLLHNDTNVAILTQLLNLLAQNASRITTHRAFGLLLQNILTKSSKNVCPLIDCMRNLIELLSGPIRIKLTKMCDELQRKCQENDSFSQTMCF